MDATLTAEQIVQFLKMLIHLWELHAGIGFDMGYDRIVTYTLVSETGASLRASGFVFDGIAGGQMWTGQRRRDYYVAPTELKYRWMKRRAGERP